MEEAQTTQTGKEAIVTATETPEVEEHAPKLIFDSDGAIKDNALLSIIQREKPLDSAKLLKLAELLSKTPMNFFLAESLRVSALMTMLTSPQLKKDVETTFGIRIDEVQDSREDSPFYELFTNDQSREDSGDHGIYFIHSNIRPTANPALASDVGLVIQSQVVNAEKTLYFVIGMTNPVI